MLQVTTYSGPKKELNLLFMTIGISPQNDEKGKLFFHIQCSDFISVLRYVHNIPEMQINIVLLLKN